jgi:hypothetical protein
MDFSADKNPLSRRCETPGFIERILGKNDEFAIWANAIDGRKKRIKNNFISYSKSARTFCVSTVRHIDN